MSFKKKTKKFEPNFILKNVPNLISICFWPISQIDKPISARVLYFSIRYECYPDFYSPQLATILTIYTRVYIHCRNHCPLNNNKRSFSSSGHTFHKFILFFFLACSQFFFIFIFVCINRAAAALHKNAFREILVYFHCLLTIVVNLWCIKRRRFVENRK